MAKGSVMSCKESPLGGWINSSKSDLTVQRVLSMGCRNESLGLGVGSVGGQGVDGAFPEESLQSVSLCDISTVYSECAQTPRWTRV